jgi:hypothetical protein
MAGAGSGEMLDGLRPNGQHSAAAPAEMRPIDRESDLQKTNDLERTGRGGRLECVVGRHGQLRKPVFKLDAGDPLIVTPVVSDHDQPVFEASCRDQDVSIAD